MDFVTDALFDSRRLRALTVVDNCTRERLAITVGPSLKDEDVVRAQARIVAVRGKLRTIKIDSGSEFISKAIDRWTNERGVELDFSRIGKPTDNAKVESLNGRFRPSARTRTGSCYLTMRSAKSRRGASTISRRVPTPLCGGR